LDVPGLLQKYGLHPDRRLGQNYLVEDTWLRKIVTAAEINPQDTVLEIGAGIGNLTRYLAQAARQVVAVEIDARIFPALRDVVASFGNVHLVQGDILALDPVGLFPQSLPEREHYLVVANIPYYITSGVIRHLLESDPQPNRMLLTIQREVADRICAEAGGLSLLALSVQVYGKPAILGHIPAGAFYPVPKVDSAGKALQPTPHPPRKPGGIFQAGKSGFQPEAENPAQCSGRRFAQTSCGDGSCASRRKNRSTAQGGDFIDRRMGAVGRSLLKNRALSHGVRVFDSFKPGRF
jgi:16S rRNA (adenine1518-N6/adenine1519-N6)-dimethyltransferase